MGYFKAVGRVVICTAVVYHTSSSVRCPSRVTPSTPASY